MRPMRPAIGARTCVQREVQLRRLQRRLCGAQVRFRRAQRMRALVQLALRDGALLPQPLGARMLALRVQRLRLRRGHLRLRAVRPRQRRAPNPCSRAGRPPSRAPLRGSAPPAPCPPRASAAPRARSPPAARRIRSTPPRRSAPRAPPKRERPAAPPAPDRPVRGCRAARTRRRPAPPRCPGRSQRCARARRSSSCSCACPSGKLNQEPMRLLHDRPVPTPVAGRTPCGSSPASRWPAAARIHAPARRRRAAAARSRASRRTSRRPRRSAAASRGRPASRTEAPGAAYGWLASHACGRYWRHPSAHGQPTGPALARRCEAVATHTSSMGESRIAPSSAGPARSRAIIAAAAARLPPASSPATTAARCLR